MKTSFNGLQMSKEGIYHAYNLSVDEFESLKRHFGDKVNGSKENCIVCEHADRRIVLNLFVHEVWIPLEFDMRGDLLRLFKSNKIFQKDIKNLSRKLKEMKIQLHVDYDWKTNSWHIVEYDKFLELLSKLIAEL